MWLNEADLHIVVDDDQEIQMERPFIYQMIENKKVSIEGKFVLSSSNEVKFEVEAYQTHLPLIIDPVLNYSTYLGEGGDVGNSIAVDSSGSAYVTGFTTSSNFPTSANAFQTTLNGARNAFITSLTLFPSPTLSAVSPNLGSVAGGTIVTIMGNNFIDVLTVSFGSVLAPNFIVDSNTEITILSPPHLTGTVDVVVQTVTGITLLLQMISLLI